MKKTEISLCSGVLLIFFLWSIVFVSTILYIFSIPLSIVNFLIVLLLCGLFTKIILSIDHMKFWSVIALTSFLLLVSVGFSGAVFDYSWDGNCYHKAVAGLLKTGWNPIYSIYNDVANQSGIFTPTNWATWYDAYPKATSIISAVLYFCTNNIEVGKAYTLISSLAGTLIVYYLLSEYRKTNKAINFLIAGTLFFNPIAIAQMVTFYNDAFLWNLLFITFFSCLYLTLGERKKTKKICLWLIFMCSSLGINTKFSALIFFTLICACFYFYWIVKILSNKTERNTKAIKYLTIFMSFTLLFSLFIMGSTSYVKNTILHQNPFYTMIGEGKTELIDSQAPKVLIELSHGERFVVSLFSQSSNDLALDTIALKVPFTVDDKEKSLDWVETRIGGWGVLFSGIIICTLVCLIFYYRKLKNEYKECFLITLLLSFIPTIFVPGLFWGRYWMFLFVLPAIVMYLFNVKKIKNNLLVIVMLALCIGNTILPTLSAWEKVVESQHTRTEYLYLHELSKESKLSIKLGAIDSSFIFTGLVFNLLDYKIENIELNESLESERYISNGRGIISYSEISECK